MKKTIYLAAILGGLTLLLPFGCYYDNEEELYGGGGNTCDTVAMKYSVQIKEILQNNCYRCHVETEPSYSGYSLATYNEVKEYANNGKLVSRTNDVSSPMPQEGLMENCLRLKIKAWVDAGAPNN